MTPFSQQLHPRKLQFRVPTAWASNSMLQKLENPPFFFSGLCGEACTTGLSNEASCPSLGNVLAMHQQLRAPEEVRLLIR